MALNEIYSFKDYTGQDLRSHNVNSFNNTVIRGSCFAQEFTDKDTISAKGGKTIFPSGMTGVTFERCNLDNVIVPASCTVTSQGGIPSCHKTIQVQNDLEDWDMVWDGVKWIPNEPVNKKVFMKLGLSINPVDIPATKQIKSVTQSKEEELAALEA